jgi:hypothetical protein
MLKRYTPALITASVILLVFAGCAKDTTVYPGTETEITRPVSFSKDLQPIFTKSCALGGCHATGGKAPILTEGSSYNSLINGNYVNLSKPESSDVYLWLTGVETPAMPLGAANNPSNVNGLTLAWIKQGAKNN